MAEKLKKSPEHKENTMIIKPKTRGFICTTAHPAGCAGNVEMQAEYAAGHPVKGPKRVLVVGSSTGYGLASRITAAFSCGADTIGVYFDRPSSGNRTATAGWYNNQAFEKQARAAGHIAESINGDAFSDEVKKQTIELIKEKLPGGKLDLVIYSVASPRRIDPKTGETYNSVLKPIGKTFSGRTVNFHTGEISQVEVEPASQKEIDETVAVMGGEDWFLWMQALKDADVLAENAGTTAFSYIGPALTHAVYTDGTIGQAKADLEKKAVQIDKLLEDISGKAFVSVNKGLVTQSSAAIPVVPLYIALLFKVMKDAGTHEGCIEQTVRMFEDFLYKTDDFKDVRVDEAGRIRLDDLEMQENIQKKVAEKWNSITTENLMQETDIAGYRRDFFNLFGFEVDGVDYEEDIQDF